jgi:BirA family biotin operon repressor/biotin-[acetyl-CoA-carboxylase] ligase
MVDPMMLDATLTARLSATRFGDVRWADSVGSTNAEAMALARAGAPEGLVVVADHQSSGRGRLGRSWVEPAGAGLLVSVLLCPGLDPEHLHLASAIVALAAADACRAEAGLAGDACRAQSGLDPALKWPNDLLLGGAKLAGILAQATAAAVVVGIGINVNWPPGAELPPGATSLNRHAGGDVDRARLMVAMLESLEVRRAALDAPSGRAAQASEYRSRCATLGQAVRIELSDETFTGTAADITPEGHLLVDVGTCLRRVSAADVVHLRRVWEYSI